MCIRTAKALATILALVGLFALASAAPAATYLVRPDGLGEYATIQDAIDDVLETDIIELADGTFEGTGNRDLDFLGKAITIRSQSGDPTTCTIDCGGDEFDPHRGFWFHSGEGSSSVVQDISVVNGHIVDGNGGAILCESASPTIEGCIFGSNLADGSGVRGGAISWSGSAWVSITGCRFLGNTAGGEGGAISLTSGVEGEVVDCVIGPGNYAGARGGGVHCSDVDIHFDGCTVTDNASPVGAGICSQSGIIGLSDCSLLWNMAGTGAGWGGGIAAFDGANISRCTFMGNSAAVAGGGIFFGDAAGADVLRSIVALSMGGGVHVAAPGRSVSVQCSNVVDNTGGNYTGSITDQTGVNDNISEDPQFCDAPSGDLTLYNTSPCAAANSPCGQLIGAEDVDCYTAVEPSSWGKIKSSFE